MPYLNSKGQIASGVGSGIVAVDRAKIDTGGGTRWVDDNTLIYQRAKPTAVVVTAPDHHNIRSLDRGANEIAGGGGHYATWLAGDGLRHSRGGWLPNAGLKDVGRDGTLSLTPNRQSGMGLNFIALQDDDVHTRRFFSLDVVAQECSVLRWGCAVWRNERNETWALLDGQKVGPLPTVSPAFRPRLLQIDGEWWLAYNTNETPVGRTLLHPATEATGYEIAVGDQQFGLDAMPFGAGVLFTWAKGEGEDPSLIVRAELNLKTLRLTGDGDDRILEYRTLARTTIPPVQPPVDPVEPPKEPPVSQPMPDESAFVNAHPMRIVLGMPKGEGKDLARAYNAFRFVAAVARDLNARDGAPNWGVQKKSSGDFLPVVNEQGYWGDGLRTRTRGVDIVNDREGEGAAPTWANEGDASGNSEDQGFALPPSDDDIVKSFPGGIVAAPPMDPPVEPPTQPADLTDILRRLDVLTNMVGDHAARLAEQDNELAAHDRQLLVHASIIQSIQAAIAQGPIKSPDSTGLATEATAQAILALLQRAVDALSPLKKVA